MASATSAERVSTYCLIGKHDQCSTPARCACPHHGTRGPVLAPRPAASPNRYAEVPIDDVVIGANVRRDVGDVTELAESIRWHGVLQPLGVCPNERGDGVELLMGQRRLAAAREAGLATVPCVLRPRPGDRDRVLMQVAENLERADMSPIDEALAFRELVDMNVAQTVIAKACHRSNSWVGNRLALLTLPDCLRVAVDLEWITPNVALEVPIELRNDPPAMARCAKVLRRGNNALRTWLRDEGATEIETAGRKPHRPVNLPIATYELAARHATADAVPLSTWVSDAIERHAKATEAEEAA